MSALAAERRTADEPRLGSARLLPAQSTRDAHDHVALYGPRPVSTEQSELLRRVEAAGLSGRGGAGFPTATKLRAVSNGRAPVVVANGVEGEPASRKDKTLLLANPHLVIDGVLTAAELVGARQATIAVSRSDRTGLAALEVAVRERKREAGWIELAAVPDRFVAGEESALVAWINGRPAKPTLPQRPFERGVDGRPTLVQNVETLANLALIARYGADWFRSLGTLDQAGTALFTVSGAVSRPSVLEAPFGTPLSELVRRCGGLTGRPQAILAGGYFGTWLPAAALAAPLTDAALSRWGGALGARTVVIVPEGVCGLAETARAARYLAAESAGQCGPCLFGLDAVATALETVALRKPGAAEAVERLPRYRAQIAGRGACRHPDGALRFVMSAVEIFRHEIALHLHGECSGGRHDFSLPVPPAGSEWR